MVIGALFPRRYAESAFLIVLAFVLLRICSVADDQITKTDGNVITGKIVGVSDGQVTVEFRTSSGGIGRIPYFITDIKSISMATPAEVTKVEAVGVAPATVIATLEPMVKQFAGLPVPWVVSAMAQLADAYTQVGQNDQALAIYNQISQLYPGSSYENVAKAGKATLSLKAGKIDEALAAVQPIIDQANKDIAPSPMDGALYANAFLVRGQVYEAQKKPQQALEDYLTVKTMFYQNPALAAQADQLATSLRDRNPGLGIE